MEVKAQWQDEMTFEVQQDGHKFLIDAVPEVGGSDQGPRPKGLLLSALAGCTAMDVISILKKMRIPVERFSVGVHGELSSDHPKRFTTITTHYTIEGPADMSLKKIKRAIQLSEEVYCGVSATLRPGVELKTKITINQEEVEPNAAGKYLED
ncbi:MAG: OsmC family protein [Deltaproteobacteria bacterium]|nr:OsmC family protein [Deltaproteobacteria bacterium]